MKKNHKIQAVLIVGALALLSFFPSCGPGCIDGNGTIVSEMRDVQGFSSVVMSSDFDVFITQDTVYSVEVEGDENLLPYVIADMRSTGTLELRSSNNRCLNSSGPIKVYVKTPDILNVTNSGSGYIECRKVFNKKFNVLLSGSGEIFCPNLDTYDLRATISGSGLIELSGKTITSNMKISGSGKTKAYGMDQNECYMTITGSGDAYVFVFDYLNVSIPGSGDVFYRGDPDLDYRIDGSGRVIDNN